MLLYLSTVVNISDGKHDVSAKCTLRVTGVTDEMLSHSITVRVLNSNDYKFLSPKQLSNFTAGLANIFETEKNVSLREINNYIVRNKKHKFNEQDIFRAVLIS